MRLFAKSGRTWPVLLAAGMVLSSSVAVASASASVRPHYLGTVRIAEPVMEPANSVDAFMDCANYSETNFRQFDPLMFRPLYWYGHGANSLLQPALSIATGLISMPPSLPGPVGMTNVFKFSVKPWKFADGSTINGNSVVFFLNLYLANKTSFCGYAPSLAIPDQLVSAVPLGQTVTLTFSKRLNKSWLLGSFLSQIVPLPATWDVTSALGLPGSGGCSSGIYGHAATILACQNVYTYLTGALSTANLLNGCTGAGASPIYCDVDGPYVLSTLNALGGATLVPNPFYWGPDKSSVARVDLVAFATVAAEEAALAAQNIDIGYVDPTSLPCCAGPGAVAGPNLPVLTPHYMLEWQPTWSFNFATFMFSPLIGNLGHRLVEQPAIREVMNWAVNQFALLPLFNKYATATCGPLPPSYPGSPACASVPHTLAQVDLALGNQYNALTGGVRTCTVLAGCGVNPKVPFGTVLSLTMLYAGVTEPGETPVVGAERAMLAAAPYHIKLNLVSVTAAVLVTKCTPGNVGPFELCFWGPGVHGDGGAWSYYPDLYPSGELVLGAAPPAGYGSGNFGQFVNAAVNAQIVSTTYGLANLNGYVAAVQASNPDLWQPNGTFPDEIATKCTPSPAPSPYGYTALMPQYLPAGC